MPKDAEAHYALGSLLMHVRKYPEAQQELLLAVQLKPDLADAYGNLAVVAAENKNYQLTLKALDYRAKFVPEDAATYFLRATTFDQLESRAPGGGILSTVPGCRCRQASQPGMAGASPVDCARSQTRGQVSEQEVGCAPRFDVR